MALVMAIAAGRSAEEEVGFIGGDGGRSLCNGRQRRVRAGLKTVPTGAIDISKFLCQ